MTSFSAIHAAGSAPAVLGIPVDFILFALTLIGVAVFHRRTLQVALVGLAAIALYKLSNSSGRTKPSTCSREAFQKAGRVF